MVKFDAVVGNPPYQIMDMYTGKCKADLQLFRRSQKKTRSTIYVFHNVALVYAGGKVLDLFRCRFFCDFGHRLGKIVAEIDK